MSRFDFDGVVTVERLLSAVDRGCIFSARIDDGQSIRVKFSGSDMQPLPGDAVLVKGQLSSYRDRFGKVVEQIDCKIMQRQPCHGALLGPWLRRLPNVGSTRAQNLVNAFGGDLAAVLSDPNRIADVTRVLQPDRPELSARVAAQVFAAIVSSSSSDRARIEEIEFLQFLELLGVRESRIAAQLWRFMAGPDAVDRLNRNPYAPAHLMDWVIADRIGMRLLRHLKIEGDVHIHPARLVGALNSVWREVLGEGDTAASRQRVETLLRSRGIDPILVLAHAESEGHLRQAGELLRAPGAAWMEDHVVCAISAMETRQPTVTVPSGEPIFALVVDAECATGLQLYDDQRTAVISLLRSPFAALQGGAGVGKTTVMRVLARAWEILGGDVIMGALAGKAALQLSRQASSPGLPRLAHTLTRLIGMLERQRDAGNDQTGRRNASDLEFTSKTLLIIDEAGMMDTPTLHRILRLLPAGSRLLLAGDEGQLFPIGIGKVFHDIVAEGSRVAVLTKVRRQAEDSVIPTVSQAIRLGTVPDLLPWNGESKGVFLVSRDLRESVQIRLQDDGDLLVVAARKATVDHINDERSLAKRHRNTPTRRLGPLATVAEGDPIVITANRTRDGLFNGLLGVVVSIGGDEVELLLDGESRPRALPKEAEADIELAYAITCHKAQGSSARAVMVIVEASPMVSREWLYTAITRAKQLVVLIEAQPSAIANAVNRRTIRISGMKIGPAMCQPDFGKGAGNLSSRPCETLRTRMNAGVSG